MEAENARQRAAYNSHLGAKCKEIRDTERCLREREREAGEEREHVSV